jgi:hypothetical protein
MPGALGRGAMSQVNPAAVRHTDTAQLLNLHFNLPVGLTNAFFVFSRYGSETNTVLLDSQTVASNQSAENVNLAQQIQLGSLASGNHVIGLRYDGGGANNNNLLDAVALVGCVNSASSSSSSSQPTGGTCADNIDNDNDGLIDYYDPDCHTDGNANNFNSYDRTRYEQSNNYSSSSYGNGSCGDGVDNDSDSLIDYFDPDCHTDGNAANFNSFDRNRTEQYNNRGYSSSYSYGYGTCSDSMDNDGDGLIDASDPDCHTDGNANNANSYDRNRTEQYNNGGGGSSYGNITVTKDASVSEVLPGGMIDYTIRVSNNGPYVQDLDVRDTFDPLLEVDNAGNAQNRSSNQLTWIISSLPANQSATIRYSARAANNAPAHAVLHNSVRVTGSNNIDQQASADVSVLGSLPQTGGDFRFTNGQFLRAWSNPLSASLSANGSSASQPEMLTVSLVSLLGLALGGLATRRLFI